MYQFTCCFCAFSIQDYTKETPIDLGKTWVDNNIMFSTSILCIEINNNYRTAHWHIVGNKAKGRISKRVFQEIKARQIF